MTQSTDTPDPLLLRKFRGCLVGGLVGDCIGALFDWRYVAEKVLAEHLDKVLDENDKSKSS